MALQRLFHSIIEEEQNIEIDSESSLQLIDHRVGETRERRKLEQEVGGQDKATGILQDNVAGIIQGVGEITDDLKLDGKRKRDEREKYHHHQDNHKKKNIQDDVLQVEEDNSKHRKLENSFFFLDRTSWGWVSLSFLGGWLVLLFLIDPAFVVYWFYVNGAILWTAYQYYLYCHQGYPLALLPIKQKLGLYAITGIFLLLNWKIYCFLSQYELEYMTTSHFTYPNFRKDFAQNTNSSEKYQDGLSNMDTNVIFYQMYSPILQYMNNIEAIHQYMNSHQARMKRVEVYVNSWLSDVYRYEFILHFWKAMKESSQGQLPQFVCLAESDVVFRENFLADVLNDASPPLEIAHTQHFWGHRYFEPYNLGIFCASIDASMWSKVWAYLMSSLHCKRYRRLLPLNLFVTWVSRFVLHWDLYHGCTIYYPSCEYIHFTAPKVNGIAISLQTILAEQKQRPTSPNIDFNATHHLTSNGTK